MQKSVFITYDEGIILFDPAVVKHLFPDLKEDDYLLEKFLNTDYGDKVLAVGGIVPILNIDVGEYVIYVRLESEKSIIDAKDIFVTNEYFFINIESTLCLADISLLKEWSSDSGYEEIQFPKGKYSVQIKGFKSDVAIGYEFVLSPVSDYIDITGDVALDMGR